jgi:hypothetical protein
MHATVRQARITLMNDDRTARMRLKANERRNGSEVTFALLERDGEEPMPGATARHVSFEDAKVYLHMLADAAAEKGWALAQANSHHGRADAFSADELPAAS